MPHAQRSRNQLLEQGLKLFSGCHFCHSSGHLHGQSTVLKVCARCKDRIQRQNLRHSRIQVIVIVNPGFRKIRPDARRMRKQPSQRNAPLYISPKLRQPFLYRVIPVQSRRIDHGCHHCRCYPLAGRSHIHLRAVRKTAIVFPEKNGIVFHHTDCPARIISFVHPGGNDGVQRSKVIRLLCMSPFHAST